MALKTKTPPAAVQEAPPEAANQPRNNPEVDARLNVFIDANRRDFDYYTKLDFDFGVSIDHLIVKSTAAHQKQRYQLTIQNAEDFLREHTARGLGWTWCATNQAT